MNRVRRYQDMSAGCQRREKEGEELSIEMEKEGMYKISKQTNFTPTTLDKPVNLLIFFFSFQNITGPAGVAQWLDIDP